MKRNLFINVNMGESLKKYCLAFAVFVMSLVAVNSINNIGGTYAADTSCPSGYNLASNDTSKCCPSISGTQASYNDSYGCVTSPSSINECPSGYSLNAIGEEPICVAGVEKAYIEYSVILNPNGGSWNSYATELYGVNPTENIFAQYYNDQNNGRLDLGEVSGWVTKNGNHACGWNVGSPNGDLKKLYADYEEDGKTLYANWDCHTTTPDPEPDDEPTQEPETPDPEPETPDTPSGKKYTVGFVIDDGVKLYVNNKVTSSTNFSLEEIDLSDFIAEKDGYVFNGWASTDFGYSCTNNPALDEVITLTEDVHFKPCFSSGKYKIQFSLAQDEFLYYEGNETGKYTFSLSELDFSKFIAKKEGYTFTGWSSLATMNTCAEPITDKIITVEKDMRVMPCFVESAKYSVTFELNGGSLYKDGSKTTTTTYNLSSLDYSKYKAEKTGYIFKGWRTSGETCANASLNKKLTLSSKLSLFACYEEDSDIKENPNTGSFLLYVAYLIGVLSLGYTIYYAYKGINAKN